MYTYTHAHRDIHTCTWRVLLCPPLRAALGTSPLTGSLMATPIENNNNTTWCMLWWNILPHHSPARESRSAIRLDLILRSRGASLRMEGNQLLICHTDHNESIYTTHTRALLSVSAYSLRMEDYWSYWLVILTILGVRIAYTKLKYYGTSTYMALSLLQQ